MSKNKSTPDPIADLVYETTRALTVAENMRCLDLDSRQTADGSATVNEIVRAAMSRLPLPATLLEACKLVADLTAAIDRGMPDQAASRCAQRIGQLERAVLRTWPAASTDEVIARLTWLQTIAEDGASEIDHDTLRDVLRITLHDLRHVVHARA